MQFKSILDDTAQQMQPLKFKSILPDKPATTQFKSILPDSTPQKLGSAVGSWNKPNIIDWAKQIPLKLANDAKGTITLFSNTPEGKSYRQELGTVAQQVFDILAHPNRPLPPEILKIFKDDAVIDDKGKINKTNLDNTINMVLNMGGISAIEDVGGSLLKAVAPKSVALVEKLKAVSQGIKEANIKTPIGSKNIIETPIKPKFKSILPKEVVKSPEYFTPAEKKLAEQGIVPTSILRKAESIAGGPLTEENAITIIKGIKPAETPKISLNQLKNIYGTASRKGLGDKQLKTIMKNYKDFTGKDKSLSPASKNAMTSAEADNLITIINKFNPPKGVKPSIPKSTNLAVSDFFNREYRKPTIAELVTPMDTYLRHLGVYDLVEPSINAKMALEKERGMIFEQLDKIDTQIDSLGKTRPVEHLTTFIKNQPTRAKQQWFNLLDTNLSAPADLSPEEKQIFNTLRGLTNSMLARTNEVRVAVGLEPINKMSEYITHIFDMATKAELKTTYAFPEELSYILSKVNTGTVYNPTALERIGKETGLLRDPIKALKAMVSVDLKQIYMSQPIQMFNEQLNALGRARTQEGASIIPADTRKYLEDYMRIVIKGQQADIDRKTDNLLYYLKIPQAINLILKPFGRGITGSPTQDIVYGINRFIFDSALWARPKQLVLHWLQNFSSLAYYDSWSTLRSVTSIAEPPELTAAINRSLLQQNVSKNYLESLPQGILNQLETIGFKPLEMVWTGKFRSSMKAAWYNCMVNQGGKWIVKPAYAKLGWTIEDVYKEMDFGANTTQFWYNLMGMPGLWRYKTARIFTVLQSFVLNYTFKFMPELMTRTFYGRTGWGKLIPASSRVGALRYIVAILTFEEAARKEFNWDYRRMALFGALPQTLAFSGYVDMTLGLTNIIKGITTGDPAATKKGENLIKKNIRLFIPGSGLYQDINKWMQGKYPLTGMLFYLEQKPKISKGNTGTSEEGTGQ